MTKRKILLLFIVLVMICIEANAQNINELGKTVVFLQKQIQAFEMKAGERVEVWYKNPRNNNLEPKILKQSGTGFIINHNGKDYIVTAKHVAKFLDDASEVLLNISQDSSISISFQLIRKSSIFKNANWFNHPIADISIHPIAYPTEKLDALHFNTNDISKNDIKIDLLTDVIILGFPLGLGVHESISPIAKKTQIASNITTIDLPEISPSLKFYLLDQALAQGYSGSPVFCLEDIPAGVFVGDRPISAGEKVTLIGILSAGLSDATGGKISVVVPISYLWEILDSPEFLKYESQFQLNK